jgi:hypothetical protein
VEPLLSAAAHPALGDIDIRNESNGCAYDFSKLRHAVKPRYKSIQTYAGPATTSPSICQASPPRGQFPRAIHRGRYRDCLPRYRLRIAADWRNSAADTLGQRQPDIASHQRNTRARHEMVPTGSTTTEDHPISFIALFKAASNDPPGPRERKPKLTSRLTCFVTIHAAWISLKNR